MKRVIGRNIYHDLSGCTNAVIGLAKICKRARVANVIIVQKHTSADVKVYINVQVRSYV